MWTTITEKDSENICIKICTKALDKAIKYEGEQSSFNYYNSDVSGAFHKLVKPIFVGKVQVGYEYKGYLMRVEATGGDCEYAVTCHGLI